MSLRNIFRREPNHSQDYIQHDGEAKVEYLLKSIKITGRLIFEMMAETIDIEKTISEEDAYLSVVFDVLSLVTFFVQDNGTCIKNFSVNSRLAREISDEVINRMTQEYPFDKKVLKNNHKLMTSKKPRELTIEDYKDLMFHVIVDKFYNPGLKRPSDKELYMVSEIINIIDSLYLKLTDKSMIDRGLLKK